MKMVMKMKMKIRKKYQALIMYWNNKQTIKIQPCTILKKNQMVKLKKIKVKSIIDTQQQCLT